MKDSLRNFALIPAVSIVSLSYGARGHIGLMIISLALGGLLYFWRWPRRYLASSAWVAFNCLVVVLALKPDFPVWLQGAILLIALAAWDIDAFCARIQSHSESEPAQMLIRQHLVRLSWVLGLGALLMILALALKISIGFWLAALLAVTTVIGISALVSNLRSR